MEDDVQQRVLTVISDVLNLTDSEVPLNASLRKDLNFDSLKQMSLFIALEDEFDRTIPPEQVAELDSVKDIVEFIHRKLQKPFTA